MYAIQRADLTYASKRYHTEAQATRALARRKEEDSAVVWCNDAGEPKMWVTYWWNGRVGQVGDPSRNGKRTA